MWICKNVRCSGQELPPFFSAEFESLFWGHAGTEPGEAGQSLPFQFTNEKINTSQNFWFFFNNANKKARDPSALNLPIFQTEMQ